MHKIKFWKYKNKEGRNSFPEIFQLQKNVRTNKDQVC